MKKFLSRIQRAGGGQRRHVFAPHSAYVCSFVCAFALLAPAVHAQDTEALNILPQDIRITQSPEGGYNLYIRKKNGVASVLLTETTKDPSLREDNYAYRTPDYNAINGDERRILDGRFIEEDETGEKRYFLVDSTPSPDPVFGESFHIWIPYVLIYGYNWTRHGEVQVLDGTFLNIRSFEKPYADYSGAFKDNPYRLKVTQKPVRKEPERNISIYMTETVDSFSALADGSGGSVNYASSPEEILPIIRTIIHNDNASDFNVAFVIDATESMKNDIKEIRKNIPVLLKDLLPKYTSWRIALVLYKDYFEDFTVKTVCGLTNDMDVFSRALKNFSVQGGRDIPEAVYEGINEALDLSWDETAEKRIILIGDAPPHPKPRGRVTKESVLKKAEELNVKMDAIILPHEETY